MGSDQIVALLRHTHRDGAVDGSSAADCGGGGGSADQRGAGADLAAGHDGLDRAAAGGGGRGGVAADAVDGAPDRDVHGAVVFRFPSVCAVKAACQNLST